MGVIVHGVINGKTQSIKMCRYCHKYENECNCKEVKMSDMGRDAYNNCECFSEAEEKYSVEYSRFLSKFIKVDEYVNIIINILNKMEEEFGGEIDIYREYIVKKIRDNQSE